MRKRKVSAPSLWPDVIEKVKRCVFRVEVGNIGGTAFLVSLGKSPGKTNPDSYLFATAGHVIRQGVPTAKRILMYTHDGTIGFDTNVHKYRTFTLGPDKYDTGIVIFESSYIDLALEDTLPLLPHTQMLRQGADIGWVGFPGLAGTRLCFFSGVISAYLEESAGYLVDGVAINGVSGGPAFNRDGHLIGIVSAYLPNRRDETTTLPGLMSLVSVALIDSWMDHTLTQEKIDYPPIQ